MNAMTAIALLANPSARLDASTAALRRSDSFTVPFSKLFLASTNVRNTKQRAADKVQALAAMIAADGLLSDLQVSAELDKQGQATGRYGVQAGGNRLMAIGLLVTRKLLAADEPVPCQLVAADRATAVSLAENISIQAMHPADEYLAFSALIAQGKTVEAVAAHFGVRTVEVERRMRLARVAPSLFAQYREDKLSLDQLMALASTDDQKRQLAVWKSLPAFSRSASSIKRRLTENEVKADDWRVKLIGLDRYTASGGTLRSDLFTEDAYLADAGLVDLIVAEVLTEAEARARAEGWAWVEVFETMGYEESQRFSTPPAKYVPETDAVCAKREAMEAEIEKLEEKYEALQDGDDESEGLSEKLKQIDGECDELRAKIDAFQRARLDTSGYDKSVLGAVIDSQGCRYRDAEADVGEARRGDDRIGCARHRVLRKADGRPDQPSHGGDAGCTREQPISCDGGARGPALRKSRLLQQHAQQRRYQAARMPIRSRTGGHPTCGECRGQADGCACRALEGRCSERCRCPFELADRAAPGDRLRTDRVLHRVEPESRSATRRRRRACQQRVQRVGVRHGGLVVGRRGQLSHARIQGQDRRGRVRSLRRCGCGSAGSDEKGDACAKAAELLLDTCWLPSPLRFGKDAVVLASTPIGAATLPEDDAGTESDSTDESLHDLT